MTRKSGNRGLSKEEKVKRTRGFLPGAAFGSLSSAGSNLFPFTMFKHYNYGLRSLPDKVVSSIPCTKDKKKYIITIGMVSFELFSNKLFNLRMVTDELPRLFLS